MIERSAQPRRFPPPWTVEELDACFVVTNGLAQLGYEVNAGRAGRANNHRTLASTSQAVSDLTSADEKRPGWLNPETVLRFPSEKPTSAQRFDEAPKLDSCLGSGTVAVISIPLAFRRAAACTMHSAHLPPSHCRRTTRLPGTL